MNKQTPYNIIGNGIMVAKAEDVRRIAKEQFDAANKWCDENMSKNKYNPQLAGMIGILEQAIKICEDYSQETWAVYKGYMESKGYQEGIDSYTEGKSDGAEVCADKLRNLLEKIKQ